MNLWLSVMMPQRSRTCAKCAEKLYSLSFCGEGEWDDGEREDMRYASSRLYKLMISSSVPLTKDGAVYLRNKLNRPWERPLPGLPELDELNQMADDGTVTLLLEDCDWLSRKMAGFPGDQERAEEAAATLRNVASLVAGIDANRVSRPTSSANLIEYSSGKARRLGATEHEVESALRMVQ